MPKFDAEKKEALLVILDELKPKLSAASSALNEVARLGLADADLLELAAHYTDNSLGLIPANISMVKGALDKAPPDFSRAARILSHITNVFNASPIGVYEKHAGIFDETYVRRAIVELREDVSERGKARLEKMSSKPEAGDPVSETLTHLWTVEDGLDALIAALPELRPFVPLLKSARISVEPGGTKR